MGSVLVTGEAGVIGPRLVDALVERGRDVKAFDNLDAAAHPQPSRLPSYANPQCQHLIGDIRDKEALRVALRDVEVVVHHAAAVGSGISMVEVRRFVDVNSVGTANLLELLIEYPHRIQEAHITVGHILCGMVEDLLPEKQRPP